MSTMVSGLGDVPEGYADWLADLKQRVHCAQQRAALAVNSELVSLYWQIGCEILDRQAENGWGSKIVERLAHDLRAAFPDVRGFSRANLMYMRAFASAWTREEIVQQPVGQLPWAHNLVLLTKLKTRADRIAYARAALEYGWSRNVLALHIDARRLERSGQALTNFKAVLPEAQTDLARESLKDPYKLDFLGLGNEASEREIETAIAGHITEFLLELGVGFAYVGRQVHLEVGDEDFFLDLLFYHLKLRCYVVIELKAGKFKPEHLGQLGFYLAAVDAQVKDPADTPTIGLLLCRTKNEIVAEYALRDNTRPLGIAEYELAQALPAELGTNLPTIEQIEREFEGGIA